MLDTRAIKPHTSSTTASVTLVPVGSVMTRLGDPSVGGGASLGRGRRLEPSGGSAGEKYLRARDVLGLKHLEEPVARGAETPVVDNQGEQGNGPPPKSDK